MVCPQQRISLTIFSLRFLNLSGNPSLDLTHTLAQLKEHERLEQVSFGSTSDKSPLYFKSRKYRDKVLVALLMNNPKLKWIDNVGHLLFF